MSTDAARYGDRYYAVRQFHSGKVLGSPLYDKREDAEREVTMWREQIGRAAVAEANREVAHAVHVSDQAALMALLAANEPKVWVSTTSHRSRDRLALMFRIAEEDGPGPEYTSWPSGKQAHGAYYQIPERLAEQAAGIKGVTVLRQPPRDLRKCWTHVETGGPERGNWAAYVPESSRL